MVVKNIPAVTARVHFGEIIRKSFKNGDRFIVEKSGIPMVVILNANDYARIVEQQEERFRIVEDIRVNLPSSDNDTIEADVALAVKHVRQKKSRA